MRANLTLAAAATLLLGAVDAPRADRIAVAAADRAAALERQADAEPDAVKRSRLRQAAVAARIRAAQAAIAASKARVALTDRRLAAEGARLAERQLPAARLVAAVQALSRRPAALAIMQPGSTSDIVHARALLGTLLPVVHARTEALRQALARTRALRAEATEAATALADANARLQSGRLALARLQAEDRARGAARGGVESEQAIALGEQARDLAGMMAQSAAAADVRTSLGQLDGPLPRPGDTPPAPAFTRPPYRLPVRGRIVEGLGELSDTGVRSRGLRFAVAAGAPVIAPAAGRIVFARRFRDYGTVVIIDHGNGWSSALTGLDAVDVVVGDSVTMGQPLGRAAMAEAPRVGVELRRRGLAVDLARLIG
ncbi:murein hydrolase activator EnvC family protein [Sphingomonas sp. Leaf33]|uniref:murein hydrolase activator EnvC family protein n=1 Tax=Sphingomonas sp. Leaf33 TaxID=1736215 RepID=UPI000A6395CE|nr:peptidoglycan DD-metalloendopeptidase family protein [Sphingomonas sp. Leaf33]